MYFKAILWSCLVFLVSPQDVRAWNDILTHPRITESAIDHVAVDSYFVNNLNLGSGISTKFNDLDILTILQKGSKLEDDPNCRAANHFLNPNLAWSEAGLSDKLWLTDLICLLFSSYYPDAVVSNITWATGIITKDPVQEDITVLEKNEMDWLSGREYYYGII